MKIYYAHPMSWYNTPEEAADLEALAIEGDVVNPNGEPFHSIVRGMFAEGKDGSEVMKFFTDYIRDHVDVVAFRRFKDKKVGAGVAQEILAARIWGKQLWFFESQRWGVESFLNKGRAPWLMMDVLSIEETKRRIKEGVM